MVTNEFLEVSADFYGSWTLDEIADRFNTTTVELMEYLADFLDEKYDDITEEILYTTDEEVEDED
jgi:hypothetical protein